MTLSRFVIAGAANTGITYIIYLILLQLMPYVLAYSVTYLAGIALGYMLNAYLVFKEQPAAKSALLYPLVYVMNYFFGLGLLYVVVEFVGLAREIAPLLVIAFTVPFMFIATKYVFKGGVYEKAVDQ